MSTLAADAAEKLRASRAALFAIPKEQLSGTTLWEWWQSWQTSLQRADGVAPGTLYPQVHSQLMSYRDETDHAVAHAVMTDLVDKIDKTIQRLDSIQPVKPVLDTYITMVADNKLATMLREFNSSRATAPNLAAIGFRTILSLIIRERARKVNPSSKLATSDIDPEPALKAAIGDPSLFEDAERRWLKRYLSGGDKDTFDIVAHKPNRLIDKDELSNAASLLNHLLPTIVDPVDKVVRSPVTAGAFGDGTVAHSVNLSDLGQDAPPAKVASAVVDHIQTPTEPISITGSDSRVRTVDLPAGRYQVSWTAKGSGAFIVKHELDTRPASVVSQFLPDGGSGDTILRIANFGPQVFNVHAHGLDWRIAFAII